MALCTGGYDASFVTRPGTGCWRTAVALGGGHSQASATRRCQGNCRHGFDRSLTLPLRTRRFIGGCRRSVAFLHRVTRRPQLEPALERVIELWRLWRHDINRIHREALDDIASLVNKMHEHTMAARSAPVRATCTTPGKFRRRSL